MTQPIPESVLRETVEVCKSRCPDNSVFVSVPIDFARRAADPSHGMEAMAERLLELEAAFDDAPHDEDCAYIGSIMRRDERGRRVPTAPCNCWKSRIGEATGKDSSIVQGEVKAC